MAAADRLRTLVPSLDQIGRLDGDQFAVVIEAADGPDLIEAASLRLLRAMMLPLRAGQHAMECSVSLGVAVAPGHGDSADAVLRSAHSALDQAKQAGGGVWRLFDPEQERALHARLQLCEELRTGIESGQVFSHYQPIIDLTTGLMAGLEVLARWNHPSRGMLEPAEFIPIAEEAQLAGQISQALMRRLLADSRHWPTWLYFAFNVSPGQLRELIGLVRNPPYWPEGVLDPRRLEIEVTESLVTADMVLAREVVGVLQSHGTRVVLDDFGAGTSNFAQMRDLPFDRIKIDRSFMAGICRDERAQACVKAMLALGQTLGVDMVAEGIETAESSAYMAGLGCRFAQGFFYAEPVPASGVPGLVRRFAAKPAYPRQLEAAV